MQSLDQLSSKFHFRFYNTIIAQKDKEEERRGEEGRGKEERSIMGKSNILYSLY